MGVGRPRWRGRFVDADLEIQWICYQRADRETPHEEPVVRSRSVSGWRADELLNFVLPLHDFEERLIAVKTRTPQVRSCGRALEDGAGFNDN